MMTSDYDRDLYELEAESEERWGKLSDDLDVCGVTLRRSGHHSEWGGGFGSARLLLLKGGAAATLEAVQVGSHHVSVECHSLDWEPLKVVQWLEKQLRNEFARRIDSMQRQIADLDEMARALREEKHD